MTCSTSQAVAYLRVSTDDQTLGLDAQRQAIEAWASREGVAIVAWHADRGVSGGAPVDRRPGLLAALEAVRSSDASMLVAAKRCRLGRCVVTNAMVERLAAKAGARVVTADGVGAGDGPEAELMRCMVDAFAQYERALIRSRTRAALQAKASRGEHTGGSVPYGSRLGPDGTHLEPDPTEQHVVERVVDLAEQGHSQRRIAARLNAEGLPARGARWHATSVGRVLRRRRGNA